MARSVAGWSVPNWSVPNWSVPNWSVPNWGATGWAGAGLLLAGFAGTPALASDAVPFDLAYDLSLGGLTVMSFELEVRTTGDRYAMDFSGRTRGMMSLFGHGSVASSSEGRLRPDGTPVPEVFISHSDGNEGERQSHIQYGSNGPTNWVAEPMPGSDGDEVTPVPPASIPGTRDILTALLDFAAALGRNEACTRDMHIFDGRRRFDLRTSDRGMEVVTPEGVGFYAGPAHHCHLDLDRIGGYPTDTSRYMSGNEAEFWLAPVLPGEPPVPVEIVFKGRLGMMHARLALARHGADLRGTPETAPQSAAVPQPHDDPR
ncbi:hypothetical protein GCM10011611_31720 [Aliidongia dinghuensis]|uniref:DUF3108 domain-containing protein n=2 Tax=Aliidongia dinghuensis TaxID=1867774 RepID=A0A8J2YW30_9PROT|nr:hypothetical protein GCM10011611_31720 [Aliidongia dinghuensis]